MINNYNVAKSFFDDFFSSRRRHTRWNCDWSSDVCSSDLLKYVIFRHSCNNPVCLRTSCWKRGKRRYIACADNASNLRTVAFVVSVALGKKRGRAKIYCTAQSAAYHLTSELRMFCVNTRINNTNGNGTKRRIFAFYFFPRVEQRYL